MLKKDTSIKFTEPEIKALKNEKGEEISDAELVDFALDKIKEYRETNKTPAPIPPKFVQWLEQAQEHIKAGGDIVDFKKATVLKSFVDYGEVVDNTFKKNEELAKRGAFDSKIVKRVEGSSK
jgi:hypothetical protein|nr:MAG TPA: hypothetical protein [Caudoviricetes sp.]